jgi:hypothetical protein
MSVRSSLLACSLALVVAAACHDDHDHDPNELISTVILSFAPSAGGAAVVATFDDPDGDGGAPPTVDPVNLVAGTTYTLTVRFQNNLGTVSEEITDEIRDEGTDHQVFFTGSAVDGPASDKPGAPLTHSYADTDSGGLPLGLTNTIVAAAGTGDLIVTLLHVPPVNGNPVKTLGLAAQVKSGGFSSVPGSIDAQVTFPVTVP